MGQGHTLSAALHEALCRADPFEATELGVTGYEAHVPDVTPRGLEAAMSAVQDVTQRAQTALACGAGSDDEIALSCVVESGKAWLAATRARQHEHTTSPREALGRILLVASQTTLSNHADGDAYIERLVGFGRYLDACRLQLAEGARRGRIPVATVAQVVLRQVDDYLCGRDEPLTDVGFPTQWRPGAAWRTTAERLCRDVVRPAAARYRDALASLPKRPDEACGLAHIPDGPGDYEGLVAFHTTTTRSANELHAMGLAAVAELRARFDVLGHQLGFADFEQARAAAAGSGCGALGERLREAEIAVRRAEAAAPDWFPDGEIPPCQVLPMPRTIAQTGMSPYYTAGAAGRAGTYWFNTVVTGIGCGWELEATAFHEAVPGHHLQDARRRLVPRLPAMQLHRQVTAHDEGWALYAERLADEMGLYSSPEQKLGALGMRMLRAVRLVVDTGLHAHGWSRGRALEYFTSLVPLPPEAAEFEVNRYVATPGQALAYHVGQTEIMRLRDRTRERLGQAFDIRSFHAAVLDHGAVPLATLEMIIDAWARQVSA